MVYNKKMSEKENNEVKEIDDGIYTIDLGDRVEKTAHIKNGKCRSFEVWEYQEDGQYTISDQGGVDCAVSEIQSDSIIEEIQEAEKEGDIKSFQPS